MSIGQAIKSIRLARKAAGGSGWTRVGCSGWTQAACAERAGMPQGQWADLERGRCSPRTDTLERVAAAMECSVADLFNGQHFF